MVIEQLRKRGLRGSAIAVLISAASIAGCSAGWQRIEPISMTPPPRTQVQVFESGSRMHRLHAIRITADSVTGVPFTRNPGCEECRVGFPRTTVDSIRVGDPEGGFVRGVGIAFGSVALVMVWFCVTTGLCGISAAD